MNGPVLSAMPEGGNRLVLESSPYLRQHAHNPVAWYPWGTEALEKARREDKLLMVSIGYAACHWCHVMARESFADPETAAMLNRNFVSIKVDREERPDLDGHFMDMIMAMTGQGGWPLNMFLTPDLQPVFGGTYFPPEPRHGLPSFVQLLASIAWMWSNNRTEMLQETQRWHDSFLSREQGKAEPAAGDPEMDFRGLAIRQLAHRFDHQQGGFGVQPKFPQPLILSLFLRQSVVEPREPWGKMVRVTLDRMAAGGVRDQLAGAFHRYAVDRYWQVPHFEIMLYDNALLARVLVEAFQRFGHDRHALLAREILDDLLVRLLLPDGTFASSLNAESQGEEGSYYSWTRAEMEDILGAAAQPVMQAFVDEHNGTVDGRSVLRFLDGKNPERLTEVWQSLTVARQALLRARQQRPAPSRDDKVLTSWNGLMISALAKAGAVLEEPRYLQAALRAWEGLWHSSRQEDGWRHSRLGLRVGREAFVDDYAFLAQALLDLYEADFQMVHLEQARTMVVEMLARFQPAPGELLQLTPVDSPQDIPVRQEWEDGVIPSGNSSALLALRRLACLTQDPLLEREATAMARHLVAMLSQTAAGVSELLAAWDFAPERVLALVVAGSAADPATRALLREVRRRLVPGLVLALVDPENPVDGRAWPLLAGRTLQEDKPAAYLCGNFSCSPPVTSVAALAILLG